MEDSVETHNDNPSVSHLPWKPLGWGHQNSAMTSYSFVCIQQTKLSSCKNHSGLSVTLSGKRIGQLRIEAYHLLNHTVQGYFYEQFDPQTLAYNKIYLRTLKKLTC